MNPKLTVLMPVYNGERFLSDAIESILGQTYKDFELLIINDGSADRSREIILSYDDPRIILVENQQNQGIPRTRNIGLKLARGKYVACMDADDISMPDRLEKQIKFLVDNPEVGLVAGWIEIVGEDRKHLGFWRVDKANNTPEEIYYTLHFRNCIAQSSVLFDKDIVLKCGGYDERFTKTEDFELWLRLSKTTKVAKIKQVLVKRREYNTNTSLKLIQEHKLNTEKLYFLNFPEFLTDNKSKEILLFIKDLSREPKPAELGDLLKVFNQINDKIILEANPHLLSIKKLKTYCRIRKNHFIFNFIKKNLYTRQK